MNENKGKLSWKQRVAVFFLIAIPLITVLIAYYLPVIPYVVFSVGILIVILIFGTYGEWDDTVIAKSVVDILKAEAAIVAFGIGLTALVLNTLPKSSNTSLGASILLLGSGFFVFSMIFGALNLFIAERSRLKKWAGWAMIFTLLYGLFGLLLGWSYILKPILDSLFSA
jgi:hypothetical protein